MRQKELGRCVRERSLLVDLVGLGDCGSTERCRVPVASGVAQVVWPFMAMERMVRSQSGLGMSSRWGRILAFRLIVLGGINFTNFASHAKISNFTDTHLVDQHILQLDVTVDVTHCVVHVLEASDDLPEHHASVVVWETGMSVALEDIE